MICERCGFEYLGDSCPACAAREAREEQESIPKPTNLGKLGMIFSFCSYIGVLIAPFKLFFGFISMVTVDILEFGFAIAGIVLSIMGKAKYKADGCATAGIIISIMRILMKVLVITLFLSVFILLFFFAFLASGSPEVVYG